jgi:Uma2 family endonuclease
MRRPDIAYLTKEQLQQGKEDIDVIPEFMIEVISKNDIANDIEKKLMEYFKYGVKVVWLIYPELQIIKIHHSFKNHQTCTDDDICSASPVLEGFEIRVNELF